MPKIEARHPKVNIFSLPILSERNPLKFPTTTIIPQKATIETAKLLVNPISLRRTT